MSGPNRTNSFDLTGDQGERSHLTLSQEEKRLYGQLFKQGDPEGLGIVTGEVARTLFEKSGLAPNVLGEIWQIADVENKGFLDQVGFSIALRIIGHVQSGQKPTPSLGEYSGQLPIFDGRARHEGIVAPVPISAVSGARVPQLTPADRIRYVALFDKSAPNGVLEGEQARNIFLKAKLPNETLGQIWNLADTQGRGQLNQTEFIIAMHLIQAVLSGSLKQLPMTLPPGLYEAAAGGRPSSRTSPRIASPAMRPPIQPAVNRQYTGGSISNNSNNNVIIGGSSIPRQETGQSGDWVISSAERARFDSVFAGLDKKKSGLIGPDEVVPFLTTSKLPEEILAQIWDLADTQNTGQFSRNEFAIAMYLIQQKLAGKDLPHVLPSSLRGASRQSSVSSVTGPPNPVFLPGSPVVEHQDSFRRPPPPQQQRNVSSTSSINDLADLNDIFSSSPLTTGIRASGTGSTSSPGISSPVIAPAMKPEVKQFVPSSSFGQSLARQDSGLTVQAQPIKVPAAGSNRDLLADGDSEVSGKLSQATMEYANLSNQIGSLTTQSENAKAKREKAEAELARTLAMNNDIEGKLATLRQVYEAEVRKVKEVEDMLNDSRAETQKLQQEYSVVEATYHATQTQHQDLLNTLEYDKQENTALKQRIRGTNDEITALRDQLETLKKESRQQKGLVAINSKQLSVSEEERDKLQKEIDFKQLEQQQEQERSVAAPFTRSHQPSGSGNPFFQGSCSQAPNTSFAFTADQNKAFEEAFSRMDVASPSSADPALSSTHNTEDTGDTPVSSPPTSDLHDFNAEAGQPPIPVFTLPIARPESATSSVQNNPPLSVRGDLDTSRPDSPTENISEPVSGIVPPEDLATGLESSTKLAGIDQLRQTSLDTLTPESEAAPPSRSQPVDMEASSESFEMVNAEDHEKPQTPEPKTEEKAESFTPPEETPRLEAIVPGSFPQPSDNVAGSERFPPIEKVEQYQSTHVQEEEQTQQEDSSSDEEGPEDLEHKALQHADDQRKSSASDNIPLALLSGKQQLMPQNDSSASLFATPPPLSSSPSQIINSVPEKPAVVAASSLAAPSGPPAVEDMFASAFSGLSEAKEEKDISLGEEFNFSDAKDTSFDDFKFDDFHASFQPTEKSSTTTQQPAASAVATSNDEWEQLFAGFGDVPPVTSEADINDAFSLPNTTTTNTNTKPMTPHSQALAELTGMGFSHNDALDALKKRNYDLAEASNYLLDH